jgi:hypothetical protein
LNKLGTRAVYLSMPTMNLPNFAESAADFFSCPETEGFVLVHAVTSNDGEHETTFDASGAATPDAALRFAILNRIPTTAEW